LLHSGRQVSDVDTSGASLAQDDVEIPSASSRDDAFHPALWGNVAFSLSRFFKDLVDDGGYAADGRKAGRRLDKAKIFVQTLLLNNPVPPAVLEAVAAFEATQKPNDSAKPAALPDEHVTSDQAFEEAPAQAPAQVPGETATRSDGSEPALRSGGQLTTVTK
jgi:hypothetical protein